MQAKYTNKGCKELKKANLRDLKRQNRSLILHTLINTPKLSRIEIAEKTDLSPSTVTTLISELMEEGLLAEAGITASGGGRPRRQLMIDPAYGVIVIAEVKRDFVGLHYYDMGLEEIGQNVLRGTRVSGNQLLIDMTAAIFSHLKLEGLRGCKLAGIGLLFQEDMQESDFNVMYSTSLSSENITLKEALFTQFKVPVVQEFSQANSLAEVADARELSSISQNHAFISVAGTLLASITLNGLTLTMKGGKVANLTGVMGEMNSLFPRLEQGEDASWHPLQVFDGGEEAPSGALAKNVAALAAMLCALFPLDTIFLTGKRAEESGFAGQVRSQLEKLMGGAFPQVRLMPAEKGIASANLASKMQQVILKV